MKWDDRSSVSRSVASKLSTHSCIILTYSRLRKREPLGSHQGGEGGGGGESLNFCVRGKLPREREEKTLINKEKKKTIKYPVSVYIAAHLFYCFVLFCVHPRKDCDIFSCFCVWSNSAFIVVFE